MTSVAILKFSLGSESSDFECQHVGASYSASFPQGNICLLLLWHAAWINTKCPLQVENKVHARLKQRVCSPTGPSMRMPNEVMRSVRGKL